MLQLLKLMVHITRQPYGARQCTPIIANWWLAYFMSMARLYLYTTILSSGMLLAPEQACSPATWCMAQPSPFPPLLGAALQHLYRNAAPIRTSDSKILCFTPWSSRRTLTRSPSKQTYDTANLILHDTGFSLFPEPPPFSQLQQDPRVPPGRGTAELCLLVTPAAYPQSTDLFAEGKMLMFGASQVPPLNKRRLPKLRNCLLREVHQHTQALQDQGSGEG